LALALIYAAFLTWQIHNNKANEQRFVEDAKSYRIRAEQGDPKAQSSLAYMYSHGQGVPQDYDEALRWRRKAADQGYANGEDGLGYMYSFGLGVPQDYAAALRWYRKAADQGNADGQNAVALIYKQGDGVPQDYAEALRWFHRAAGQGYGPAEYNLGNMYYDGEGVPQDRAEAVRWYQKAADHGDEYAQRILHIKWKGMSKFFKINLSIMFLGNALILIAAVKDWRSLRHAQQRLFALAGLLGFSYLAFDLLAFRYIGILTPLPVVGAISLVKTLLSGTFVALLLSVVFPNKLWPKMAALLLGLNCILVIGLDARALANERLRSAIPTLRSFWTLNGMLLGFSIVLAIVLWRTNKGRKEDPTETAGLPPTIPSPS